MTNNVNIVTTDDKAAIKTRIESVVSSYKGASKDFASVFISLCERFTGKDSHSGDMFQHLLNNLGDDAKSLRGAVVARLREFSDDSLKVEWQDDKEVWLVEVKKAPKMKDGKIVRENGKIVYTDKSIFKKDVFIENVNKAKAATNPLKAIAQAETEDERKARLANAKHDKFIKAVKSGKAKQQITDNLKTYIQTCIEVDDDETLETMKDKLKKMIDKLFDAEKPIIEHETVPSETREPETAE